MLELKFERPQLTTVPYTKRAGQSTSRILLVTITKVWSDALAPLSVSCILYQSGAKVYSFRKSEQS